MADITLALAAKPSGAAGGQLSGTYPNPSVAGVTETAGPTALTIGAVGTGQVLRRVGAQIVGADLLSLVEDHFVSGNVDTDEIGKMGWRRSGNGAASDLAILSEAGHPGIMQLQCGTDALGRMAIHLGDTTPGFPFIVGGANQIVFEALVKFDASVAAADLEDAVIGLAQEWSTNDAVADGVFIALDPAVTNLFRLRVVNASTETFVNSTVIAALDTWYRVGFVISDPDGTPSIQMYINGIAEGAPITTNIPTTALGCGFRNRSSGGSNNPGMKIDYVALTQDTDKED